MRALRATLLASSAVIAVLTQASAGDKPDKIDKPSGVLPKGHKEPQVAVSPDGKVFVVAGEDATIRVAASADGKKFDSPVEVGKLKFALGCRRGPRIAASDKTVVVSACSNDKDQGSDGDLVTWRSSDSGKTWQGPVKVNAKHNSAREGLQALAAGAKDEYVSVWLDDRSGKKEVFGARSTDGGATWIDEGPVYQTPNGEGVCPCCHPSVTCNAKGDFAAMFRNGVDRARDMWLVTSKDHGKTWKSAQKLGEGTWPGDN